MNQMQNAIRGGLTCIVVACLIQCCPEMHFADTILYNGKIITVDETFSIQEAVAVRGGKIQRVGADEKIMELAGRKTRLIDLKGRAVIPGLIEGHAHPVSAAQSEFYDTIPVLHTISDLLQWIRQEAIAKESGEWIIHPKFFITRLDDMRPVTLRELDMVAPDNPVFLDGSYGGMINTRALEISGIDPHHTGILRDIEGKPTGLIRRSAFPLLTLPPSTLPDGDDNLKALKSLFHQYNRVGFTSVCSGGGTVAEMRIFEQLMHRGDLTLRIFHNIRTPLDPDRPQVALTEDLRALGMKTGDGDEWVKTGAFKVVLDGGMLTGTAFLHEPWGKNAKELYGITDPEYRGELMFTKEQLIRIIRAAQETGWKFTAHVTGGGAVDTLLAAYEAVHKISPLHKKRFSIIHGNFFTTDAIRKMADMDIYADMQPAWFLKDTDLLHYVLGGERMKTFHPYRSLVEAGVVVNAGSDHMVKMDPDDAINPYNPFPAMWSLITRKTDRGIVYNPDQGIRRDEALKMYTINNARASFEEAIKGSLEQGKLADLVVLSDDFLTCPEDSIRVIRPLLTMVNGTLVYDSGEVK